MGRKVKELHGEESERLVGVLTNCWSVCKTKRLRERVWGEVSCKDHENKRERLERLGQKLKTGAGTQIGVPICFTEYPQLSSLAAELWTPCCPLPDWSGRRKPFVQGWTHTQGEIMVTQRREIHGFRKGVLGHTRGHVHAHTLTLVFS